MTPIIWPYYQPRDPRAESLVWALRSGLITHVAIMAGNRQTSDTLDHPDTRNAIALAQIKRVPLILVRFLWPTQPCKESEIETLYDVDFYVREIEQLREEARVRGIPFVGLDTEAYGPTQIHEYFRQPRFPLEVYVAVSDATREAARQIGEVDFVFPAGSSRASHPYMALAMLGLQRISETTYYDRPVVIDYPYEIAGMYISTSKTREGHPEASYYLPIEVFGDKAHVWWNAGGLFLWHEHEDVGKLLHDTAPGSRASR